MSNTKTLKPFQKGTDPRRNLKGRPTNEIYSNSHITKCLKDEVNKFVPGKDNTTYADLIIKRLLSDALKGKVSAIKIVLDRIDGKVTKYGVLEFDSEKKITTLKNDEITKELSRVCAEYLKAKKTTDDEFVTIKILREP